MAAATPAPESQSISAEDGFVVVLDALGTRGIWAVEKPERVLESRLRLKDFITRSFVDFKVTTALGKDGKQASNQMAEVKLRVQFLSDTLIVSIVPSASVDMMVLLGNIAHLVGAFVAEAIRDGVLYRGAISAGKFYSSEGLLIGPAIDEAAEWADRGEWAGVMLTPSAERRTRETIATYEGHVFGFVHWDIPVKSSTGQSSILREAFAVAWPLWTGDSLLELDSLFLRPPIPLDVEIKHRNTLDFFFGVRDAKVSLQHKFIPVDSSTIKPPPPDMPKGWAGPKSKPSRRGKRTIPRHQEKS